MTTIDMLLQPLNFWRYYRSVRRQLEAIANMPSAIGTPLRFEPSR